MRSLSLTARRAGSCWPATSTSRWPSSGSSPGSRSPASGSPSSCGRCSCSRTCQAGIGRRPSRCGRPGSMRRARGRSRARILGSRVVRCGRPLHRARRASRLGLGLSPAPSPHGGSAPPLRGDRCRVTPCRWRLGARRNARDPHPPLGRRPRGYRHGGGRRLVARGTRWSCPQGRAVHGVVAPALGRSAHRTSGQAAGVHRPVRPWLGGNGLRDRHRRDPCAVRRPRCVVCPGDRSRRGPPCSEQRNGCSQPFAAPAAPSPCVHPRGPHDVADLGASAAARAHVHESIERVDYRMG